MLWVILVLLLIGVVCGYPGFEQHQHGYWPSGAGLVLALIVLWLIFR